MSTSRVISAILVPALAYSGIAPQESTVTVPPEYVQQRLQEVDDAFLTVWKEYGTHIGSFAPWYQKSSDEELKARFQKIEDTRDRIYVQDPQHPTSRNPLFWLPQELVDAEYEKYKSPVSFGYNRVTLPHNGSIITPYNASIITLNGLRFLTMVAPTQETKENFFRVLASYNISALVRLSPQIDDGEEECVPFWKEHTSMGPQGERLEFLGKNIAYVATDTWEYTDGLEPNQLLDLILEVRRQQSGQEQPFIAVESTGGMSRCGTFIEAYMIAHEIDTYLAKGGDKTHRPEFSIDEMMWKLSLQRGYAVSYYDQYLALYKFAEFYWNYKTTRQQDQLA